jgi:TonB family protein
MRPMLFAGIALLCSSIASATNFEARSEHYALSVTVADLAANVVVTDLATNSAVLTESVPWTAGQPAEITRDVGDVHFALRLSRSVQFVNANLEVDRGEMEIDLIRGEWILAPRRAHVRANGAMRVGGNVHAPMVVHRVEPVYPEEARRGRVSGVVIIETLIDETGHVADAVALKPLPSGLTEAALDAVRQWVFEPGTFDGKPVPVIFNLTVNFKIDTPPPAAPR